MKKLLFLFIVGMMIFTSCGECQLCSCRYTGTNKYCERHYDSRAEYLEAIAEIESSDNCDCD